MHPNIEQKTTILLFFDFCQFNICRCHFPSEKKRHEEDATGHKCRAANETRKLLKECPLKELPSIADDELDEEEGNNGLRQPAGAAFLR